MTRDITNADVIEAYSERLAELRQRSLRSDVREEETATLAVIAALKSLERAQARARIGNYI